MWREVPKLCVCIWVDVLCVCLSIEVKGACALLVSVSRLGHFESSLRKAVMAVLSSLLTPVDSHNQKANSANAQNQHAHSQTAHSPDDLWPLDVLEACIDHQSKKCTTETAALTSVFSAILKETDKAHQDTETPRGDMKTAQGDRRIREETGKAIKLIRGGILRHACESLMCAMEALKEGPKTREVTLTKIGAHEQSLGRVTQELTAPSQPTAPATTGFGAITAPTFGATASTFGATGSGFGAGSGFGTASSGLGVTSALGNPNAQSNVQLLILPESLMVRNERNIRLEISGWLDLVLSICGSVHLEAEEDFVALMRLAPHLFEYKGGIHGIKGVNLEDFDLWAEQQMMDKHPTSPWTTQSGYTAQPGYTTQPGFSAQTGYTAQPDFSAQTGFRAQTGAYTGEQTGGAGTGSVSSHFSEVDTNSLSWWGCLSVAMAYHMDVPKLCLPPATETHGEISTRKAAFPTVKDRPVLTLLSKSHVHAEFVAFLLSAVTDPSFFPSLSKGHCERLRGLVLLAHSHTVGLTCIRNILLAFKFHTHALDLAQAQTTPRSDDADQENVSGGHNLTHAIRPLAMIAMALVTRLPSTAPSMIPLLDTLHELLPPRPTDDSSFQLADMAGQGGDIVAVANLLVLLYSHLRQSKNGRTTARLREMWLDSISPLGTSLQIALSLLRDACASNEPTTTAVHKTLSRTHDPQVLLAIWHVLLRGFAVGLGIIPAIHTLDMDPERRCTTHDEALALSLSVLSIDLHALCEKLGLAAAEGYAGSSLPGSQSTWRQPGETWRRPDNPLETWRRSDKPMETWRRQEKPTESWRRDLDSYRPGIDSWAPQQLDTYRRFDEHDSDAYKHGTETWRQGTETWRQGTETWRQGTETWRQPTEAWRPGAETWRQGYERQPQRLRKAEWLVHFGRLSVAACQILQQLCLDGCQDKVCDCSDRIGTCDFALHVSSEQADTVISVLLSRLPSLRLAAMTLQQAVSFSKKHGDFKKQGDGGSSRWQEDGRKSRHEKTETEAKVTEDTREWVRLDEISACLLQNVLLAFLHLLGRVSSPLGLHDQLSRFIEAAVLPYLSTALQSSAGTLNDGVATGGHATGGHFTEGGAIPEHTWYLCGVVYEYVSFGLDQLSMSIPLKDDTWHRAIYKKDRQCERALSEHLASLLPRNPALASGVELGSKLLSTISRWQYLLLTYTRLAYNTRLTEETRKDLETAGDTKETARDTKETAGDTMETAGDTKETAGDTMETGGDTMETGGVESAAGYAWRSLARCVYLCVSQEVLLKALPRLLRQKERRWYGVHGETSESWRLPAVGTELLSQRLCLTRPRLQWGVPPAPVSVPGKGDGDNSMADIDVRGFNAMNTHSGGVNAHSQAGDAHTRDVDAHTPGLDALAVEGVDAHISTVGLFIEYACTHPKETTSLFHLLPVILATSNRHPEAFPRHISPESFRRLLGRYLSIEDFQSATPDVETCTHVVSRKHVGAWLFAHANDLAACVAFQQLADDTLAASTPPISVSPSPVEVPEGVLVLESTEGLDFLVEPTETGRCSHLNAVTLGLKERNPATYLARRVDLGITASPRKKILQWIVIVSLWMCVQLV